LPSIGVSPFERGSASRATVLDHIPAERPSFSMRSRCRVFERDHAQDIPAATSPAQAVLSHQCAIPRPRSAWSADHRGHPARLVTCAQPVQELDGRVGVRRQAEFDLHRPHGIAGGRAEPAVGAANVVAGADQICCSSLVWSMVNAATGPLPFCIAGAPARRVAASLLLPMGRFGPAFLAYDNFQAYLKWNASLTYSTTAAYYASALKRSSHGSKGPLSRQSVASAAEPTISTAATAGAAHRCLRSIRFMGTLSGWESPGILTTGVAASWPSPGRAPRRLLWTPELGRAPCPPSPALPGPPRPSPALPGPPRPSPALPGPPQPSPALPGPPPHPRGGHLPEDGEGKAISVYNRIAACGPRGNGPAALFEHARSVSEAERN
jgi:hypothetical protein